MFADKCLELLRQEFSLRARDWPIPSFEYQVRPQHVDDWLDNSELDDALWDYLNASLRRP